MNKLNELSGRNFGRLTVIKQAGRASDRHVLWLCVCKCGNRILVRSRDLLNGHTKSCGCLKEDVNTKHGGRGAYVTERLYFVWRGMKNRCECQSTTGYKDYGGRGIRLCKEWHNYANFREWAFANGYNPNAVQWECTIDRINNDGDYEPSNCRWVSMKVQSQNKRHIHQIISA